jgi:hypothetical protein
MSSAGALFQRGVASTPNILEVMRAAAKALGVDLSPIEVSGPEEFESAFASWAEQKVGTVVVLEIFASQSAAIAAKRRIASIGSLELATAGGLIGYGVDLPAMYRRAAVFVAKDPQGRQARRHPDRARDEVSNRRQSEGGQSARDRHPAGAASGRSTRRGQILRASLSLLGDKGLD